MLITSLFPLNAKKNYYGIVVICEKLLLEEDFGFWTLGLAHIANDLAGNEAITKMKVFARPHIFINRAKSQVQKPKPKFLPTFSIS